MDWVGIDRMVIKACRNGGWDKEGESNVAWTPSEVARNAVHWYKR